MLKIKTFRYLTNSIVYLRGCPLFFVLIFFLFADGSLAREKPNFLFILAEDMGVRVGEMSKSEVQTPVLDSLAESGVLFNQAFTTCPTCSPSKASIMTGQFPHTHNLRINVHEYFGPSPELTDQQIAHNKKLAIPDQIPTLIEKLSAGGYRTGIMKKFHLSPQKKFPFDAWIASHNSMEIVKFISESANTPWFLMVGYDVTHRPFRNPQDGSLPDVNGLDIPAHLPVTEIVKRDWVEYLRAVELMDSKVGEALAALEQSGQLDNTIVIFLSDHGPAYHRAKFSPYDLGLHVPIIFYGPDTFIKSQEEAISELVSFVDLMPTILDYAGIEIPPDLRGNSLRDLLQGVSGAKGHAYIVGEVHHGAPDPVVALQERSIFDGRYRLVFRDHLNRRFMQPLDTIDPVIWQNPVYEETINHQIDFPAEYGFLALRDSSQPGRAHPFELYDRATDPWEINNLYAQAEYKSISRRLVEELLDWVVETEDRYVDAKVLETELDHLENGTTELDHLENGTEVAGEGGSTCFLITITH